MSNTLGVLIFAGTNFREFFSAYIRGYLFSRMSFYSTFAGTNFREWVVSIANFLGKYVDEWRLKQDRKTTVNLYFKTPFITEKTILKHIKRIPICFSHSCSSSSSSVSFTRLKDLSTCTNFSCFQLFIPEERKKKTIFAGTNFRESVISEIFRGY